jgi:XTP/dITP diphosphohydrolase
MNREIVIATHNANKVREYRELLAPLGYVLHSAKDLNIFAEPEETGKTYAENAYIKAKALRDLVKWPVIADDSGLEIKALGGFPGLFSARFAESLGGDYQIVDQEILRRMEDLKDREAAYHCCICLLEQSDSTPLFFEGVCEGSILPEVKGTKGFGYDPIFRYDKGELNFGECSEQAKNAVSHRALALKKLLKYLAIEARSKSTLE